MYVYMKDVLSCSFAVLLDDADSICVCRFFYCEGNLFRYLMDLAQKFLRNVEDVDAVSFWNDKRVSHI